MVRRLSVTLKCTHICSSLITIQGFLLHQITSMVEEIKITTAHTVGAIKAVNNSSSNVETKYLSQ